MNNIREIPAFLISSQQALGDYTCNKQKKMTSSCILPNSQFFRSFYGSFGFLKFLQLKQYRKINPKIMRDNIFGWGNANTIGRDIFSRNQELYPMCG